MSHLNNQSTRRDEREWDERERERDEEKEKESEYELICVYYTMM